MGYRFLSDVTSADIALKVEGRTKSDLFKSAAIAVMKVQIDDSKLSNRLKKEISLSCKNLDCLLFRFLNEIIFLKDSERFVFGKINLKIVENRDGYALSAILHGETISGKHKQMVDVKGVSLHKFNVRKYRGKYYATIVLDV